MSGSLPNVTLACFGLSYLLALAAELARLRWPRPGLRAGGLLLGGAGLFAHSLFLALRQPTPATAYGGLLVVAWVLAVFYLYGTLHDGKRAWAVFVLPLVSGLVWLAFVLAAGQREVPLGLPWESEHRVWGALHGVFVLCAAVGVSVGAVASVMYLIQADRLRRKKNPLGGLKLLSLERLETMNRRAVTIAFPFLTAGLLLGAVLLRQYHDFGDNWLSPKVLGTVGLWAVFLLLLYLRYVVHLPGRRLARLTLVAFVLMIAVLIAAHPFAASEPRLPGSGTTEARP
jgi:ABC-type transport system involved in cytochrome c biogenesis permease subunit